MRKTQFHSYFGDTDCFGDTDGQHKCHVSLIAAIVKQLEVEWGKTRITPCLEMHSLGRDGMSETDGNHDMSVWCMFLTWEL
jgi:hypothetical protein